jgi:hypothetical protein
MTSYLRLSDLESADLVHIMFTEINIPELQDYPAYAGKLKKILQINLTNAAIYPFLHADKFTDGGLYSSLQRSIQLGFNYAVVWFDGNWPKASEFDSELRSQIEVWNAQRWLAAGHIISRMDRQPEWHPQCVVVNLKVFAQLGIKHLDSFADAYPAFCSSAEHIHDNYTPTWVTSADHRGSVQYDTEYNASANPLDVLFPHAFANDCYIYNLPMAIRDEKICCYPEDDIEFTQEWLFDYDFNLRHSIADAREFGYGKVSDDKRELFQYKIMDSHIVYVTNTEEVPVEHTLGAEVMVVPCSGLHQFKYMSNNADTLKRVVWTDFSKFGLAWTQKVLSDWDGVDFKKFYYDNQHIIMDLGFPDSDFIIFDQQLVDEFIDSYETEERWLEHWDRIRSLQHDFLQVDVVKEWQRVASAVGKNCTVFVNFSNIWQYEINYINTANFDAQLSFGNLMNELLINNTTVYFTGDTPNGVHYQYQNLRSLPGIF